MAQILKTFGNESALAFYKIICEHLFLVGSWHVGMLASHHYLDVPFSRRVEVGSLEIGHCWPSRIYVLYILVVALDGGAFELFGPF